MNKYEKLGDRDKLSKDVSKYKTDDINVAKLFNLNVNKLKLATEEIVIDIYKKSNLSEKDYCKFLVYLIYKNYINAVKYIIRDRITEENVRFVICKLEDYIKKDNDKFSYNNLWSEAKEVYDILKEIESDLLISMCVSKEPYEKILTKDKVINLTGQSGSGKSYYAKQYKDNEDYLVIDTDDIFSEKRFIKSIGINKELGEMFRKKYNKLPSLEKDFDLIYNDILDYCNKYNKIILIDCAQFHCVKDIYVLKGKVIIIRTDIDTCYKRCIERYKKNNSDCTKEELEKFKQKKLNMYRWYKGSNEFIKKIDLI